MRTTLLLVTANVGSLFEESCRIHEGWMNTLIGTIEAEGADFIAIHMQEVGGKNFEECSSQVPEFVQGIASLLCDLGYSTGRAYLDLEYELEDDYNALGSIFFISDNLRSVVKEYDFDSKTYLPMEAGFEMVTVNLNECSKLRKAKFPKHFWPAIKWGRKGFMHCRFRFDQGCVDFVNVHLFHDESNIALIHENPSLYSENRKRALNYVLDETHSVAGQPHDYPLFIFGDLNFRLDSPSFLNRLTEDADQRHDSVEAHGSVGGGVGSLLTVDEPNKEQPHSIQEGQHGEQLRRTVSAIEFRRSPNSSRKDLPSSCVLRIEKKRFDYFNHKKLLSEWRGYLADDKEVLNFPSLKELPIRFPPTYPWSEDPDESEMLMKTRAPAWCDRVLMNERAFLLVWDDKYAKYDSIGKDVCMGDHKPVILVFSADL